MNPGKPLRSKLRATGAAFKGALVERVEATTVAAERTKPGAEKHQSEQHTADKVSFSFGRNWQDFVNHNLDAKREQAALQSMTKFLELPDLQNLSFCDIGCGSGLFSLVAYRLGARSIVSIDVDPLSVRCCEELRRREGGTPNNWTVEQGSVLDKEFLSRAGKADIVYAWGSLHHTGSMWQAISNAADLMESDGLLYLSIYNKVQGSHSSEHWLRVKKLYNSSPWLGKFLLEIAYALRYDFAPRVIRLQNPFTFIKSYSQKRGMSYWTDVRDWLGGYPYEFASADDIFRFCTRELHLELKNLRVTNTLGTNEFLFRKSSN